MTYLPTGKIRTITRVIIFFLLTGVLPPGNIFAHQGCQDTHKDEICPEHGVPERECSLCNPSMKGNTYEELLKKQCEHNISIIECDGCRYEVGVVKVDTSILGEIITIKEVETLDMGVFLNATGEVGANRDRFVIVSPRVPGVVKEVFADWGDHVKKGQKLALLDSIELGEARADYTKAIAMLRLAKKNYSREKSLYSQNICSKKQFLEAKTAYEQAQIELETLKEKLKLLGQQESDIRHIEKSPISSLFIVSAPFDGTVTEKNVAVGGLKDAFAPLFTISDLTRLWVWFDIYEKDIPRVKIGNNVMISVASYPGEQFEGVVTYIGAVVDEKTRTVKVRAEADNRHEKLKPGMFARVMLQLSSETENGAPVVPEGTVQTDGQKHFVFVPLDEGFFLRRDVILGARADGYVKVISGLNGNDRVVVHGGFLLKSEIMKEKFGEGCAH
ncbi:MAG: Cobalt/zinc/cadmium efflux RND transporter, membrane fusion protein, CzcB family [Candidatus Jettenia ecosi]|uniref:Cobalt/zinc/cadmium efflux RND transporter, membrane fusion protein, CzcB family n=1 Tax=Candidatus Jettenia ecosi TaxID=2494326 RepID=A0A533QI04_9BACT|nr:MAG: Cobalt/zinc/cadmium efflux RND transporter, membrane fusion protein, CzcB family [Candidatus Jettenia ecosi]